ncbi:APG12-domain-containing protein [Gymnopilus junonius]|uniref:Ubiquitin-like protein ATG12 n=1 Tax=Gymnopilus junonius TaxID=109634 RepID=A0A9P5NYH3_GYMJU|nr:APG12-domain-containing protein [Gymnopilus junonius]
MAQAAASPELTPRQSSRNLPSLTATNERSDLSEEVVKALETYKKKDSPKVVVRFKGVGNAPIMKQNVYKIIATNRFQAVIQFLRKELGWQKGEPLFLYINSTFSPAPDDTVMNLYKSFSTEGYLIVNYSTTPAWG